MSLNYIFREAQINHKVRLPEDVRRAAQEVLLLLVAVGAHSSVDDGEQRLHQTQNQRTASLPGHEHLNQVQNLQGRGSCEARGRAPLVFVLS